VLAAETPKTIPTRDHLRRRGAVERSTKATFRDAESLMSLIPEDSRSAVDVRRSRDDVLGSPLGPSG